MRYSDVIQSLVTIEEQTIIELNYIIRADNNDVTFRHRESAAKICIVENGEIHVLINILCEFLNWLI